MGGCVARFVGTGTLGPAAFLLAVALTLSGCVTGDDAASQAAAAEANKAAFPEVTPTVENPETVKYYRSDQPLHLAYEYFNRGNFGIAERYFQDAVEMAPKDVAAWVGLAACYDRIGRFDLADRAYGRAVTLGGETVEILNNEGYSYMLRGDFVRARRKLMLAQSHDPGNPTVANNLKLLDSSYNHIRRTQYSDQQ